MARAKKLNVLETTTKTNEPKKVVSTKPAGNAKCIDCGATYQTTEITYSDGSKAVMPKHGRCDKCQTIHLANLRAEKFFNACKHIGNMNNRLSADEKQALIQWCEQQFSEQIISRLTGDKIAAVRFNLKNV